MDKSLHSWLLYRANFSSLDERNTITCSDTPCHLASFSPAEPPRKSEVSMCKWQLTEYNFWFAKAANTWQIVVFPHLWETHTRLARREWLHYTSTNTPSSKERSPGRASPKPQRLLVNTGLCPLPQRALPKHQHPTDSLIQKGKCCMNSMEQNPVSPTYPRVSNQQHWVHRIPMLFPPASPVAAAPSVHTMWLNLDSKVDIGVDNLPIKKAEYTFRF